MLDVCFNWDNLTEFYAEEQALRTRMRILHDKMQDPNLLQSRFCGSREKEKNDPKSAVEIPLSNLSVSLQGTVPAAPTPRPVIRTRSRKRTDFLKLVVGLFHIQA